MTITVSTVQRATLEFDRNSTVLDLIRALTENLGGEWDDAVLQPDLVGNSVTGGWRLNVVMDGEGPTRPERWATEDGEHVAEVISAVQGAEPVRRCSCGVIAADTAMADHLTTAGYVSAPGIVK